MSTTLQADRPVEDRRRSATALARTLATGSLVGALSGLLVGGVLGRLAMRLLAVTSPHAQGGVTDDRAVVGQITLSGSVGLALVTTGIGALGGLLYLWVRRVLPLTPMGRTGDFALFAGAVGGALFLHDHPSFDYSVLRPEWLAAALFVTLPTAYGAMTAALVERWDGPDGPLGRLPTPALVVAGAVPALPTALLSGPVVAVAFVVALTPRLRSAWRSRAVTVAGSVLFVVLVAWGVYGIAADVNSMVTNERSTAPFNP